MICPDPAGNRACFQLYNGRCLCLAPCELRKRARRGTRKPKSGAEVKPDHFVDVNKMIEGEKPPLRPEGDR